MKLLNVHEQLTTERPRSPVADVERWEEAEES
jgi:hypothetical protein